MGKRAGTQRNVVVTRHFDAPRERAWKAWSEPKDIMRWWGPTGFTCPLARIDFREGGTSLVCMRAPKEFGGQDLYNTWTYTKIVPFESFDYVLRFSDKDGKPIDPVSAGLHPDMPREVRNMVTFKSLGDGKTEITVTEYDWASDQLFDLSKAGLEQCLDKMAAIFREA
jgi:uncharacterized protein YndB with AHSA1/START domain